MAAARPGISTTQKISLLLPSASTARQALRRSSKRGSSVSRKSASVSATPSMLSPSCSRHRARLPPLQRRAPEIQVLRPSSGPIPRMLPKLPPLRLKSLLHCESRCSSSQSRRWRWRSQGVAGRGTRHPAQRVCCVRWSPVGWRATHLRQGGRALLAHGRFAPCSKQSQYAGVAIAFRKKR